MIQQILLQRVIVSSRPQKLLKIQGIHLIVCFIPNAHTLDLFVVNSKQRAAADDIKAMINGKELQGCCNVRAGLHLVKEQQSSACFKIESRFNPCNVFYNLIRIISVFKNRSELRTLDEINLDNVLIVCSGKSSYGFCFSDLPCSFYD